METELYRDYVIIPCGYNVSLAGRTQFYLYLLYRQPALYCIYKSFYILPTQCHYIKTQLAQRGRSTYTPCKLISLFQIQTEKVKLELQRVRGGYKWCPWSQREPLISGQTGIVMEHGPLDYMTKLKTLGHCKNLSTFCSVLNATQQHQLKFNLILYFLRFDMVNNNDKENSM